MPQYCGSLGQGISIPMKSSGRGFHRKGPSVRPHINPWTLNGRIIVQWCSGIPFCLNFGVFFFFFPAFLHNLVGLTFWVPLVLGACVSVDFPNKWW